jgi:hypothetical protein
MEVSNPLHLLSTSQLKLEMNATNNLLFGTQGGKGGNYCDAETMSDCDCETISSFPCVILKDVVHDV